MTGATLPEELACAAARRPDHCWLRFDSGDVTFAEGHRQVETAAAALVGLGVGHGSVVALALGNRPEFVTVWMAVNRLGAVAAAINTRFRGEGLSAALRTSGAEVLVADDGMLTAVVGVADQVARLRHVVLVGATEADDLPSQWASHRLDEMLRTAVDGAPASGPGPYPRPRDPAMLLFTSGTTGRSKACRVSHTYLRRHAEVLVDHLALREDDVLFTPFPLFHIDAAVLTVAPAVLLGATAAIAPRFSVTSFWDDIRRTGATVFDFMGATLTMLHRADPRPNDRDHRVRLAWGVPLPTFAEDFERRFGVRLTELYGLTDAGLVLGEPATGRVAGSCGSSLGLYDVALHDEDGVQVAAEVVGEIVLRPREPGVLADLYVGDAEASLEARRDLWFHTGDLARADAEGNYFFEGRRADVIRRRGENISAREVEDALEQHPDVLEVAAYGVPSDLTEEDLMVALVRTTGSQMTAPAVADFCKAMLPRHMVPRYVEFRNTLPRTPTEKVARAVLREQGVGPSTWDSETVTI